MGSGSDIECAKVLIGLNNLPKNIFDNRMWSAHGECDPSNSQAMLMFEETVSKSFQIIKTLLPKINSLYQLNEELQRSVSNVERKLTKLEMDNQELHFQLRTCKLDIETRVQAINTQYNLLANDHTPSRRYIDTSKSRHRIADRKEQECEDPVEMRASRQKDRTRKIIFQDQVRKEKGEKGGKGGKGEKGGKESKRSLRGRNSIDLQQEGQSQGRVHFNLHSNVSIDVSQSRIPNGSERTIIASERVIKGKSKGKQKGQDAGQFKSSRLIQGPKKDKQVSSYASFLREIENYHFNNRKMKENYQNVMDEYWRESEHKFATLKTQIDAVQSKLQQMDPHNNLLQLVQNNSHIQLSHHIEDFKTTFNHKLDISVFQTVFREVATRLDGFHQTIRKLANKEETRRAIECLEEKLNLVLIDYPPPKLNQQSVHTVQLDINPCPKSTSNTHESHHSRHASHNPPPENTPRTLRNDERLKLKRLITSLHTNIPNPPQKEIRNKDSRLSLIFEKNDQHEQTTVRLIRNSAIREREVNLLKQKSAALLEADKGKTKARLRKERLIFQYD